MAGTDPSGQIFGIDDLLVAAIVTSIFVPEIRPFVAIAVTVVAPFASPFANGFLAGMVSSGGDVQSAVISGITASAFAGLHEWVPDGLMESAMKVAAHGVVGGLASAAQGGDFKSGFLSAGFTQAASLSGAFDTFDTRLGNAVAAAIVGGTASVIGGGKFENGAVTGAFSRMFNDWLYRQSTGDLEHVNNETGKITHVAKGYAGKGEGRNNPDMQDVEKVGPLPRGKYEIGEQKDQVTRQGGHKLPAAMRLTPIDVEQTSRPGGYLIHGDNSSHTASEGCIILDRVYRNQIAKSGDNVLRVVK